MNSLGNPFQKNAYGYVTFTVFEIKGIKENHILDRGIRQLQLMLSHGNHFVYRRTTTMTAPEHNTTATLDQMRTEGYVIVSSQQYS
jgi:hypothetical protein